MISLISRYEFERHVMLRSLCSHLETGGNDLLQEGTVLKFFKFRTYRNNANLFVADDPFAFIVGCLIFRKVNSRIFWMLELSIFQERISGFKRTLRALVFWIATWVTLYFASRVIFPSKLRKKFICKYFKFHKISEKSVIVQNVPSIHRPTYSVSQNIMDQVREINRFHDKIAVYAGAIQEGRDLDQIIKHASHINVALVLCGPVHPSLSIENMTSNPQVFYFGNLNDSDLRFLYSKAWAGYVNYSNTIVNTRYCAPVKIWEYREYGLYIFSNSNIAMRTEWEAFVDLFYDSHKFSLVDDTGLPLLMQKPKASKIVVESDGLKNVITF